MPVQKPPRTPQMVLIDLGFDVLFGAVNLYDRACNSWPVRWMKAVVAGGKR